MTRNNESCTVSTCTQKVKPDIRANAPLRRGAIIFSQASKAAQEPEVSDETGALLVYSRFITFKSFSHRPTSIEHAELLGM